ncbi:MAG: ligase-associated DNA damage response endonuclease PdeM [Planctomycetaceae bacterium]
MTTATVEVAGERLLLHPAKIVWWARRSTLLLADTHFGKAATFRQAGLPVPQGTTARMLQRWTDLLQEFRPQRMILLGDFVHHATRADRDFEGELVDWRRRHLELQMMLVRGNHDRGHAELFSTLGLDLVEEPHCEESFAFCHRPELRIPPETYGIAGHLHPSATIEDSTGSRLSLPCFHVGPQQMILPAFGEFTGSSRTVKTRGDRVFLVADNAVLESRMA